MIITPDTLGSPGPGSAARPTLPRPPSLSSLCEKWTIYTFVNILASGPHLTPDACHTSPPLQYQTQGDSTAVGGVGSLAACYWYFT